MNHHDYEFTERLSDIFGEQKRPVWVWGVCAAVANRVGWETWIVRAVAVLLLIFLTGLTLAAYFILGLLLPESRDRAFRSIREFARFLDALIEAAGRKINQWLDSRRTA